MNEIKQYPSYKDSKIKWIGEIPEQWSSHRIKDFIEFEIGGTPSTSNEEFFEGNNIWISIADLTNNNKNTINNSKTKITDEAIKKSNVKLIKKGSLLFSFKLTVGETAFAGCDLYTNEAIAAFKENKNISLKYLKYLLKVGFENNAFENIYGAKIFNTDLIKFAKIIKPSLKEQEQIAKYLDNKTTKIQQTITKNKKLITLLKEKRTTLINQTVTKGLNPNTPMKESGIDIIGNMPKHWNMHRLKYLCDIKTGDKDTVNNNPEGKYPFYVRSPNIERIDTFTFDGIAVLMAGDGVGAGKVFHYVNGKFDFHQRVYNFHNFKKIKGKYFYYYMSSKFSEEIEKGSAKSTVDSVRLPMLENFHIPIPSNTEQEKIINYLDEKTQKIDNTICKIERNIELLEEYKESLIHHVVTGKIDVRGVEV